MSAPLDTLNGVQLRPIVDIAKSAGVLPSELEQYGEHRGKVRLSVLDRLKSAPDGKLVIVTAVTPTKAGEGKTTTSISLTQGLGTRGRKVMLCLREPSMGPVFGIKGGGTGGGKALVVPMEEINLLFNGDFPAVSAAHNLLAAAIDASIYNGNPLRIDLVSVSWPRTVDMNDRQLRYMVSGLGGKPHGVPREGGFIITAASEIMAVLALATDLNDLRARVGRIVIGSNVDGNPVTAEELKAAGAMTAILKDAIKPNLVQTMEGQPALVHAGPFGNIAHGANSIIADRVALKLADYVVTEAGFASDLGFQKFCDIVCRIGRFTPSAAVLVTTVRSTKLHGGRLFKDLGQEDLDAVRRGIDNLVAHIAIVRRYNVPCVVAVNSFPTDTKAEIALLKELATQAGAETVVVHEGFARGGEGATEAGRRGCHRVREAKQLFLPHAGRHSCGPADRSDRDAVVRRGRNRHADRRAEGPAARREARAGHGAGVHGEDTEFAVPRSGAVEPADGIHPPDSQPRPQRRCRLRRRAVRRHHAHAWSGQDAGLPAHRHRCAREPSRDVLRCFRPSSGRTTPS
jgi:formate--tetrahydrofolate ligase